MELLAHGNSYQPRLSAVGNRWSDFQGLPIDALPIIHSRYSEMLTDT